MVAARTQLPRLWWGTLLNTILPAILRYAKVYTDRNTHGVVSHPAPCPAPDPAQNAALVPAVRSLHAMYSCTDFHRTVMHRRVGAEFIRIDTADDQSRTMHANHK